MKQISETTYSVVIEDNLESIFQTLKEVVLLHRDGMTVDIDFSKIRARGDIISSTQKASEGPVTFLKIFNQALSQLAQFPTVFSFFQH